MCRQKRVRYVRTRDSEADERDFVDMYNIGKLETSTTTPSGQIEDKIFHYRRKTRMGILRKEL